MTGIAIVIIALLIALGFFLYNTDQPLCPAGQQWTFLYNIDTGNNVQVPIYGCV